MIHSSSYQPRVFPVNGDIMPVEIDRLQDMSASVTLDRTKIEEVGRDGIVSWRSGTPSTTLTLRQLEYGSIEFWRKLSNLGDSVVTVNFSDFRTSMVDVAGYKTDDDGGFLGTITYPKFRLSGFGLAIGDPDALVERTFSLVGEDEITYLNDNKYYIYKRNVAVGGLNETFTLSDPTPVADPDNSGKFLFKVVRVRSGASTELVYGTEWSYDGVSDLTINGTSVAGDVIKVWYSAGSYISGEEPFVNNDSDLSGIEADSCSIYLATSNYLYRLQSVGIDATFDRYDVKEIGDENVVSRGIRDTTVRVSLGRILEAYTIEEILRGVAGEDYGKIDVRKFTENISLVVKCYSDSSKTEFKLGYKITDLAAVGLEAGVPLNDYVNRGTTLEGEIGFVTSDENSL